MRAQLPLAPDILTQDQEIDLREHVEDGLLYGSSNGYPMQVTARIMLSLHAPASSIVSNKIFCVYKKNIEKCQMFFWIQPFTVKIFCVYKNKQKIFLQLDIFYTRLLMIVQKYVFF